MLENLKKKKREKKKKKKKKLCITHPSMGAGFGGGLDQSHLSSGLGAKPWVTTLPTTSNTRSGNTSLAGLGRGAGRMPLVAEICKKIKGNSGRL